MPGKPCPVASESHLQFWDAILATILATKCRDRDLMTVGSGGARYACRLCRRLESLILPSKRISRVVHRRGPVGSPMPRASRSFLISCSVWPVLASAPNQEAFRVASPQQPSMVCHFLAGATNRVTLGDDAGNAVQEAGLIAGIVLGRIVVCRFCDAGLMRRV